MKAHTSAKMPQAGPDIPEYQVGTHRARTSVNTTRDLSAECHELRLTTEFPWSQLMPNSQAGRIKADGFCLWKLTVW